MTENEIISACKRSNRAAQQLVYDRYSSTMLGVCRRYIRSKEDAEDVMIEGFCKVLTKIEQYNGQGSFEGWIKRIMVNESLMFLRRQNKLGYAVELEKMDIPDESDDALEQLKVQDILKLLDQLPNGCRTIFNLHIVEGYKHKEIAAQLGISINTSKSQLILAKKRMRTLLCSRY